MTYKQDWTSSNSSVHSVLYYALILFGDPTLCKLEEII